MSGPLPIVERLTRYSEYASRELGGLTPADAIDLRVGPRMCVEAMDEAAALIGELYEALTDARDAIASLPASTLGAATICDRNGDPEYYPIQAELLDKIDCALAKATDQ